MDEFKQYLHDKRKEKNPLYYYGKRWPQIHHSRMRIGCSKLKADLCYNLHVIDEPTCPCGAEIEDSYHYFFMCPDYNDLRLKLFNQIAPYCAASINTLLYGHPNLNLNVNSCIFDAVHEYILETKRFN